MSGEAYGRSEVLSFEELPKTDLQAS